VWVGCNRPFVALLFIGRAMKTETIALDAYVVRTLMRDLVGHDRRPAAFLVYVWMAASVQDGKVAMSYAALAEETGLSRSSAQSAVGWLVKRKLLAMEKATVTAVPVYTVLHPWRRGRG
jgi:hypothetical protein